MIWLGLGTKPTRLGLGKHHALALNSLPPQTPGDVPTFGQTYIFWYHKISLTISSGANKLPSGGVEWSVYGELQMFPAFLCLPNPSQVVLVPKPNQSTSTAL